MPSVRMYPAGVTPNVSWDARYSDSDVPSTLLT
jgi:hypothetical protein